MTAQTDYLVIGSGATALAFVDVMLNESDATFTIVDRRHAPGGHWNDAYPFVRLHQPAANYGVPSRPLGRSQIETSGPNRGLFELATGTEVTHYYHTLMRDVFIPSGRVSYHPLSEYAGDGEIVELLSGRRQRVEVKRKLVDATRTETSIPLTHQRKFGVADGVVCVPPNDLARLAARHRRVAVLGAGKTAFDAVLFLLTRGLPASAITWVMPRDAWMWNRAYLQPGVDFFPQAVRGLADQHEIFASAESPRAIAERMDAAGIWLRLDRNVWPGMLHGATVSERELECVREIEHVIRLGRVRQIEQDRLVLERGEVTMPPDTLYVDCTASALASNVRDLTPVFAPGKIALQMVRMFQPAFSAALIGHLEASNADDAEKAALVEPAPMTDTLEDWVGTQLASLRNQLRWSRNPTLRAWIANCRLDAFAKLFASLPPDATALLADVERFRNAVMPAVQNLKRLRDSATLHEGGRAAVGGGQG